METRVSTEMYELLNIFENRVYVKFRDWYGPRMNVETGTMTLEEELESYDKAGWYLDEAFWPHKQEKPKYLFWGPNGDIFNAQELVHGCYHDCDEVTDFSSDDRQEAHWVAGRLFILQVSHKKKYGDYYKIVRLPPEDYDKWRVF